MKRYEDSIGRCEGRNGVTTMSSKKPISNRIVAGYSTRTHLLLDVDNTQMPKVLLLTQYLQREYPHVGNALLVLSSLHTPQQTLYYMPQTAPIPLQIANCYHVVFDNTIGYNSCDYILRVLTGLDVFKKMADKLRGLRCCMTLRISPKIKMVGIDPCPYPLFILDSPYTSRHDGMINEYLKALRVAYDYFSKYLFAPFPSSLPRTCIQQVSQSLQDHFPI